MPPFEIVISVWRGRVQNVYCSDATAQLTVVDWDVDGSKSDVAERVRYEGDDGFCSADVTHPLAESLAYMQQTDVAKALAAERRKRPRAKPRR